MSLKIGDDPNMKKTSLPVRYYYNRARELMLMLVIAGVLNFIISFFN